MSSLNPIRTQKLLESLKWEYTNIDLYELALTHSSYAHEQDNDMGHNERLEFLGDAVLELIISDYLYNTYSHYSEGSLTKIRANLVCEASLAQLAFLHNIGDYIYLGKGEAAYGGALRPSLLADAIEALFGALYLDVGYLKCYHYVVSLFESDFKVIDEGALRRDYKTLVQEFFQEQYGLTPVYCIIDESGPDHQKMFVSQVLLKSKVIGVGSGKSKKEAEQFAAKQAWEKRSQNL